MLGAGVFTGPGARRRAALALGPAAALLIGGCGGGTHFANASRPPTPVNLTVYVNDSRVSVSPATVGAGPVTIFVTNATSGDQTVTVTSLPGGTPMGNTGQIDSGQPAQLQLDLKTGTYHIDAGSSIAAGVLKVGKSRASASGVLLQP